MLYLTCATHAVSVSAAPIVCASFLIAFFPKNTVFEYVLHVKSQNYTYLV